MKGSNWTVQKRYEIFDSAGKKIAIVKARNAASALEKAKKIYPNAARADRAKPGLPPALERG